MKNRFHESQIAIKLTRLNLLIAETWRLRCGDLSADFSFTNQPNLEFLPLVDAEIGIEEARIERFKKGGV